MELRVFTYGSLMQGYGNHERLCQGVVSIEAAYIRGTMYQFGGSPFPVVTVPEDDILAVGTSKAAKDVLTQRLAMGQLVRRKHLNRNADDIVHGELLVFNDPVERMRALDYLEGYRPGGRSSLYRRVLVPIYAPGRRETAWTYCAPDEDTVQGFIRIPGGVWSRELSRGL